MAKLSPTDPILAKRARLEVWVKIGKRAGYGLFGLAIIGFFAGFFTHYTPPLVTAIVVALVVGSIILAPAIVFGYGIKAANRDDREHGRI